jgi:hypothetical protein
MPGSGVTYIMIYIMIYKYKLFVIRYFYVHELYLRE